MESVPAALGKADSMDQADGECRVVLRSVGRLPDGDDYETDCSTGECLYVWRGAIDVTSEVVGGVTVHVQYHRTSDPSWWEVEATVDSAPPYGYRRYVFSISEHLFGPDAADSEKDRIELVAFIRFPDGTRLFDHNRFTGDFENHVLTPENGYTTTDEGVCQPIVGTVAFLDDWSEPVSGEIRQGGYLTVEYDLDRLPDCRGTHNGYPAWDIVAYITFHPGGQHFEGSVREFASPHGQPTNEAHSVPFTVRIPGDAIEVELWFRNYTGAGSSCEAWDSNFGANYHFTVLPDPKDPRCVGVEIETGANTEDARMVHMTPYCLPYVLAGQYDATHCEFFLDGFGRGHMGHYGIPIDWLVAYLKTGHNDGEVLNAGMYTRYHDNASGRTGERFSLGILVSPGVWKTGFNYFVTPTQYMQGVDVTVEAFAFFLDVRRPTGEVVRLWQSRGGVNYTWDDAFGPPTTDEPIPYGHIYWANEGAPVYDSRSECR